MDLRILVNVVIEKNGGQENNMEKKLIQLFTEFTLTDLLGFGKLLGVNDTKMEFEDFITEIVVQFSKRRRKPIFCFYIPTVINSESISLFQCLK